MNQKMILIITTSIFLSVVIALIIGLILFHDRSEKRSVSVKPSTTESHTQTGKDITTSSSTGQTSEKAQDTSEENIVLGFLMGFLGLKSFPDESVPLIIMAKNQIGDALYFYFQKFHKYPQGSHAEIMQVLKSEYLLSHSVTVRLNEKHEFMDPWGTPYEIHISPLGALKMRSAGPNKIFGDDDDEVLDNQLSDENS